MLHMSLCYPVQGNKNNTKPALVNLIKPLAPYSVNNNNNKSNSTIIYNNSKKNNKNNNTQVLSVPGKVYPATTGTLDGQPTYRSLSLTQVSIVWSLT